MVMILLKNERFLFPSSHCSGPIVHWMESVEFIDDFCLDSIQFSCLAIHLNYEFRFNAFLTQPFFSACQKGLSFWIRKIHKNVWKVSHTPKERNSSENKSCQRKTCLSGLTHDLSFHGIHCIQSLSDVSMDKKDWFSQRKIPMCDVYS